MLAGSPLILVSMYVSPTFKLEVIKCILEFIAEKTGIPILIMGDFNMVINTQADRFPKQKKIGSDSIYTVIQDI